MLRLTGFYDDWIGRRASSPHGPRRSSRGASGCSTRPSDASRPPTDAVFADLLHAFNGPTGRSDAAPYLEPSHGVHPNQRGHDLIARVLLGLGLAPLRGEPLAERLHEDVDPAVLAHPRPLVQLRRAGRALRVHAQHRRAQAPPVQHAELVLQQRQRDPPAAPRPAHGQVADPPRRRVLRGSRPCR